MCLARFRPLGPPRGPHGNRAKHMCFYTFDPLGPHFLSSWAPFLSTFGGTSILFHFGSPLGGLWEPFGRLLETFGSPLGGLAALLALQEAPRGAQEAPKVAQEAPKRRPRGAQEPSEGTFEDPSGRISAKKIDKKIKYFSERLFHRILH